MCVCVMLFGGVLMLACLLALYALSSHDTEEPLNPILSDLGATIPVCCLLCLPRRRGAVQPRVGAPFTLHRLFGVS